MFCTTTTPFAVEDIVPILSKPVLQVETAWKILQPFFGSEITFGIGRVVSVPNFFDVIAMSVLVELLLSPQSVDTAAETAILIAEEVATCVDSTDAVDTLGKQQQVAVLENLKHLFDKRTSNAVVTIDYKTCWAAISRVFEGVKENINQNHHANNSQVEYQRHTFVKIA